MVIVTICGQMATTKLTTVKSGSGAGDTFNAAVIGSLLRGRSLADSVKLACQVLQYIFYTFFL